MYTTVACSFNVLISFKSNSNRFTSSHFSAFSVWNRCCAMGGPVQSRWPRPWPRACDASQMPWSERLKPALRA